MPPSSSVHKKRPHNHIDAGGDENKMSESQKSVAIVVHASVPGCKARRTAAKEALKRGAKEQGAHMIEVSAPQPGHIALSAGSVLQYVGCSPPQQRSHAAATSTNQQLSQHQLLR